MILHRSARGVLSTYYESMQVIFRSSDEPAVSKRTTMAAFREGALDEAILKQFGLRALVESHARAGLLSRMYAVRWPPAEPEGRPVVACTWSFGAGDPRVAFIRGRTVTAMAGGKRYEASFDVHLQTGFPSALAEALGRDVVDGIQNAVALLHPLPCFCFTGADQVDHYDTLEVLCTKTDTDAPIEIRATVARCTVCQTGWSFEVSGDSHHGFDYTLDYFDPLVRLSEEETDQVVATMRAGEAQVMSGGSRCHTTFLGRGGELFIEDFDEGVTKEEPCDERSLRYSIAGDPDGFIEVLRVPLKRALRDALLTKYDTALTAMGELMQLGECLFHMEILETVLGSANLLSPASPPSENDAYHAIMSALRYEDTPETAAVRQRFMTDLAQKLTPAR